MLSAFAPVPAKSPLRLPQAGFRFCFHNSGPGTPCLFLKGRHASGLHVRINQRGPDTALMLTHSGRVAHGHRGVAWVGRGRGMNSRSWAWQRPPEGRWVQEAAQSPGSIDSRGRPKPQGKGAGGAPFHLLWGPPQAILDDGPSCLTQTAPRPRGCGQRCGRPPPGVAAKFESRPQ